MKMNNSTAQTHWVETKNTNDQDGFEEKLSSLLKHPVLNKLRAYKADEPPASPEFPPPVGLPACSGPDSGRSGAKARHIALEISPSCSQFSSNWNRRHSIHRFIWRLGFNHYSQEDFQLEAITLAQIRQLSICFGRQNRKKEMGV